ncbi:Rieske (2Fe-2S) protein [Orrella marina]|uniref:2Fe-2S ferredoxin n=1 Tax=Orrella marina TaxID=2163011 RepID=A0A2R4XGY8_9BURK|nr:Rieske (2Fe-2S) protein [Orrella marina]AWB32979.1 2Fe-2S ferredoxin [Orrella marina]
MEHRLCHIDDIPHGTGLALEVQGRPIGVMRAQDTVYAFKNMCPHKRAPLAFGTIDGTMLPTSCAGELNYGMQDQILKCPWHGWEFSIETGKCLFGVSDAKVKTYPVTVRDGEVFVAL